MGRIFACFILSILASLPSLALALPDNIYMTVPNGSQRYIMLQLPDDSGWPGRGEVEYTVTMSPEPLRSWSDFSQQIVRTDENNTVQIPIYFSRKGNSSCSQPFTLTISAPSVGVNRIISGGACESSIAGVSTAQSARGQSVSSALNQNFGAFDMAFAEQGYFVQPGGIANITVLVSSYQAGANLHVTLAAGSSLAADAAVSLGVSPASQDASFGSGGQRQLGFQVQAPNTTGSYVLLLNGSITGCTAQVCTVRRSSTLTIGSAPAMGGFTAQLFPTAINTQQGASVTYRLTIYNNDATKSFNVSMLRPYGIETDFAETAVSVGSGAQQSIDFRVTPTGTDSSYELDMYISSEGATPKLVTGYLNVNGMAAGAQRGLEAVQATGNRSAINQANQAYSQFNANPSLNGYGTLQNELNSLASQAAAQSFNGTNTNATKPVIPAQNYTQPTQPAPGAGLDIFGKDLWILVIVVGIGFAASVVFYMKKGKSKAGKGLKQEFTFREGLAPA